MDLRERRWKMGSGRLLAALGVIWTLVCTSAGAQTRDSMEAGASRPVLMSGTWDVQGDTLPADTDSTQRLLANVPDGTVLWYHQNPRLVRADRPGGLSFEIRIAGEVEEVTVERDPTPTEASAVTSRWARTSLERIEGLVVSVFTPTWSEAELWDKLGWSPRGYDQPGVGWGQLHAEGRTIPLSVRVSPVNLPPSTISRIDDSIQYASHVVNVAVPEPLLFGHQYLTHTFYEHFVDEYDSIAVVLQRHGFAPAAATHLPIRNPIAGLGRDIFDQSADYGSEGTLRGIETYYGVTFPIMRVSNHELGHVWADFWDWPAITGLDLAPCSDGSHYPVVFPGTRYVSGRCFPPWHAIAERGDGGFEVVGAAMPLLYHPATLYRMGLIEPEALGEMIVFRAPGFVRRGVLLDEGHVRVHLDDIVAHHGPRSGPVDSSWRRATLVVSRGELLSAAEMSYWNFFAARHAATRDVRTFGGSTSFYEATGGRATLSTDVTPRTRAKIPGDLEVSDMPVDPREFRGVRLDEAIPARFSVGDTLRIVGTGVESTTGYTRACLTVVSTSAYYGTQGHDQWTLACSPMVGTRFAVFHTFTDNGSRVADQYMLQLQLVEAGGSPSPPPVSSVTGISVEPRAATNRPPTAARALPDLLLTLPGTREVDVSEAFVDPDGDALTYGATAPPGVVTVSAAGAHVTLTAVSAGMATIRVTATDPGGLSATQSFTATVTRVQAPFTDDPIRAGVTPVRAIHFTELRERIDLLRSAAGLERVRWTDPVLRAGTTPVRLVHLMELRSALAEAYAAAAQSVPPWTSVAGTTRIRAEHLMELRAAVVALE